MADTDLLQAWKHFRYVIQEKKIRAERTQLELLSWKVESPSHPSSAVSIGKGSLSESWFPICKVRVIGLIDLSGQPFVL